MQQNNLYLKYLTRSHTILGIFVIFIFYISTYFGTITLFKPYVNSWQNPSRHFEIQPTIPLDLDKAVAVGLEELNNPTDKIKVMLPSFQDKAIGMKYGFSGSIYINPYTNELLNTKYESDFLTNFFNQMHINMKIPKVGQIVMGLVSIAMVFLTISGVFLWLKKRKQRSQTKSSFWFKWHKDLSLVMLPYILVFSLTGAVLGVMLTTASPFAYSATDGKETVMSKLVRPVIFPSHGRVKKSGDEVPMHSINSLHHSAKKIYPNLHITQFTLYKWGDKNARIVFSGYLDENRILSARVNRATLILSGATGEVIQKNGIEDTHIISQVMSAFYFFHFLTDEGFVVRILFFLFGLLFGASLIFGMFIWLEKKLQRNKEDKTYFDFVSKFTTALTMGIIPASCFVVLLYWLIPFHIMDKQTWLMGGFFSFWCFTLFYSVYIKDNIQSVKFFMKLSGIFLLLSVFLHGARTNSFFWQSYTNGLVDIFWIDIFLVVFSLTLWVFAKNIEQMKFLQRFKGF